MTRSRQETTRERIRNGGSSASDERQAVRIQSSKVSSADSRLPLTTKKRLPLTTKKLEHDMAVGRQRNTHINAAAKQPFASRPRRRKNGLVARRGLAGLHVSCRRCGISPDTRPAPVRRHQERPGEALEDGAYRETTRRTVLRRHRDQGGRSLSVGRRNDATARIYSLPDSTHSTS